MTTPPSIAAALADAARTINTPHTLDETLESIARSAQRSIPGFDHAGISTLHSDGRIETLAGTDQLVWELDELQYELDEGPCVTSMRETPVVAVSHADQDERWPRYMPQAVERGLRSQLALRLYSEDDTIGGLNLYSTSSDEVPEDAYEVAELFATHAPVALGRATQLHQLNEALTSRKLVGQALGLVMERYRIDEDRAFEVLRRASQTSNIKLRDVARQMVEGANQTYAR